MQRIYSLQALRFFAALAVVHAHGARVESLHNHRTWFTAWNQGAVGVDLFFVLSGAVICHQIVTLRPKALTFALNRLKRVVPIYWLATGLCALAMLSSAIPIETGNIIASLTFQIDRWEFPVLAIGWTLSFEMLFYAGTSAWIRWRVATPWALLGLFLMGFLTHRWFGSPIVLEFLFGVGVMLLWLRRPPPLRVGVALALAGATLMMFLPLPREWTDAIGVFLPVIALLRAVLVGIPAAIVVFGALSIPLRKGVLTYLGDASYSIYLAHWILFCALGATWWPASIFVPVSVLCGLALYELADKPLIRFFKAPKTRPALA